ncbi:hypothetical protein MMC11_000590 [Xylographa trunciseda]|nr:hypothetical protein [Xylographa trunciseda]
MDATGTPGATMFNTEIISAPVSLVSIPTDLVTAPAWTLSAMDATSTLFGGALSQVSITEGFVPLSSNAILIVATEPEAATSSSPGSFPSGAPTTSSPSSSPSAAIVGAVVAGLVGALLISVLICWLRIHHRKRRSRSRENEKTDIVVQTLFDVPPSEVFGDSEATSAGTTGQRTTGSGIFAFINRRQTVGGEVKATSQSRDERHTTNGEAETNTAFNPVEASEVTEGRHTTGGKFDAASNMNTQRHTTGENLSAASNINTQRNTIGGIRPTTSNINTQRHTTGGNLSAASNFNTQRHTVGGIADTIIKPNSGAASEVPAEPLTTGNAGEVNSEVTKCRDTAGLKVETDSDNNQKRHTIIGGEARVGSVVTNKRNTTGSEK